MNRRTDVPVSVILNGITHNIDWQSNKEVLNLIIHYFIGSQRITTGVSTHYLNRWQHCVRSRETHFLIYSLVSKRDKTKFKMPQHCSVPLCSAHTGGHKFPSDEKMNMKWRMAIKRLEPGTNKPWIPRKYSVVCEKPFTADDYMPAGLSGSRKRLKPGAVPSIFYFNTTPSTFTSTLNAERVAKRRRLFQNEPDIQDVGNEEVVSAERENEILQSDADGEKSVQDHGIQCEIINSMNARFSIFRFKNDNKAIQYYTGFNDFAHFSLIFSVLGPAVNNLDGMDYDLLLAEDQLFLTIIKLRQAKDDIELSILFRISQTYASKVVNVWINFMFFQLQEINFWPERNTVQDLMPVNFKKTISINKSNFGCNRGDDSKTQ
ncbi:uncharacterized protein LOC143030782 [Oratosquilla oratoria]|uniref:uncharacterized protein LOC143030782 n=1 Tax=Oratosquilla oratoria TaxID=337810 RepID=UPI003F77695C